MSNWFTRIASHKENDGFTHLDRFIASKFFKGARVILNSNSGHKSIQSDITGHVKEVNDEVLIIQWETGFLKGKISKYYFSKDSILISLIGLVG